MKRSKSDEVQKTLQGAEVHEQWESSFRTDENASFYDHAFSFIADSLKTSENQTILDVGCGIGEHSIRLARHGFVVTGIDFSEYALEQAIYNLKAAKLINEITIEHQNILLLTYPDESFDNVLCWGVLMHIPDVEQAISELIRIVKPGGRLVISEGNQSSLESIILRSLRKLLGIDSQTLKRTPAGMEHWRDTASGKLMTRHANPDWLKKRLVASNFVIEHHVAGQFTELYTRTPRGPLRKTLHLMNNLWFRYLKAPGLAFGNILIARKQA